MNQELYLENLLISISNNEIIDVNLIENDLFRKLKPFHKSMLWLKSCESQSIFYENFFSKKITPSTENLKSAFSFLIKNSKSNKNFIEHLLNKYPDFFISENQQCIVNFPIDYWDMLYSRTILNPSKITHSLHILFNEPEKNGEKIEQFINYQKKGLIFSHPEMFYLMMFFSYMEDNSEKQRTYFSMTDKVFKKRPLKFTDKHLLVAKIIYSHFDNIFDFIKPEIIKKSYEAQSFNKIITNEEDFVNFIQFISSFISKEKLETKLKTIDTKVKKHKI